MIKLLVKNNKGNITEFIKLETHKNITKAEESKSEWLRTNTDLCLSFEMLKKGGE